MNNYNENVWDWCAGYTIKELLGKSPSYIAHKKTFDEIILYILKYDAKASHIEKSDFQIIEVKYDKIVQVIPFNDALRIYKLKQL
jgi:hypothetical protein